MPTTITIDPLTRIEGHLSIEITVDDVGGQQQVVDARSSGTMFRGFEQLLLGATRGTPCLHPADLRRVPGVPRHRLEPHP
jgi:coenzyme F420-reducing hydrogenase alpha subunit